MSGIKCEVIEDLITLYVDNLSSEESNKIIEEHLESCTECKIFLEVIKTDEIKVDIVDKNNNTVESLEKDLIRSIKRKILNKNLVFALIGAFVSVAFTLDMFIFNAIILLPAIGAIVYLTTRKFWIAPITVGVVKAALEFITMAISMSRTSIYEYRMSVFEILKHAGTMGIIFGIITIIGVVIGILIKEIFLENNEK